MLEFTVGAHSYRAGKIDARKQFHLVRRLVPTLVGLISLAEMREKGLRAILENIGAFTNALARMSDEDADYIMDTLLAAVQRKIEGDRGWASVSGSAGMMFEDISLALMMRLAFEAGRENLQGFFDELQSAFLGEQATA